MMKQLKKLFSVLVSYVLVISIVTSSFDVTAANTPQYSIENQTVNAGEAFTVDITLENATDVFGGNFTLQYDSDLLEVREYAYGDILSNHTKNCNLDYQSVGNLIRFTFSGATAVGTDDVLLSLTFIAKQEVEEVTEITFQSYKIYGTAGTILTGTVKGATITMQIAKPGVFLQPNISQNGTLSTDSTENVYRFTPTKTTAYRIVFDNCSDSLKCVVKKPDDTVKSTNNYCREFIEVLAAGETYELIVSEMNAITTTSTYDITICTIAELTIGTDVVACSDDWYTFVPETSGTYKFYDASNYYTEASLYNSNNELLATAGTNLFGNEGFRLTHNLNAGEIYVLYVSEWGGNGSFYVGVKQLVGNPNSIEIMEGDTLKVKEGDYGTLSTTILPEDCISGDVTWTSSDETIVSVYSDGRVAYLAGGKAVITASLPGGLSDSIEIEVVGAIEIIADSMVEMTVTEANTSFRFKFTPEISGMYRFYAESDEWMDTEVSFIDPDTYEQISGDDKESDAHFTITYEFIAGYTYWLDVDVQDVGDVCFVIDTVSAVEKIEIISYPERMKYYADQDDWYDLSGLELEITMADGTSGTWEWAEFEPGFQDYPVRIERTEEFVYISCGGKQIEFSFEIIENPVESIEIASGVMPELRENVDGWYDEDEEMFIYDVSAVHDIEIKINYKDGTSKCANVESRVEGYWIEYDDSHQYENPFTLGDDNYITVTYVGHSICVPVTVVENPVSRIEFISAPTHVYIVGDETYGVNYDTGEYRFMPTNLDGFSFRVIYKDGAEEIYTSEDIDWENWSVGQSGFNLVWDEFEWEIGENTIIFEYMNCSLEYTIIVEASPVAKIEVIKPPTKTEYEERYNFIPAGMQIKITYKDNTSEIVEFTGENTVYSDDASCCMQIGQYRMNIFSFWSDEDFNAWVSYLGSFCDFEISYVEMREIKEVKVSGSYLTGEDVVLDITYADGTAEILELNFVSKKSNDWCVIKGYATTVNGLLEYWVEECDDGYYIYILETVEIYMPKVEDVALVKPPNKVVYGVGETLDLKGMELKQIYSNGSYELLERGYEISGFDSTTTGTKVVTITYGEHTVSFAVVITDANIVVSSTTCNVGRQVKVTISLNNNPGIASATLRLKYDPSVMTLVGIEDKGNLGTAVHSNQFTNPYVLNWVNDTLTENIVYNGEIATLIFEVSDNAVLGEYAVNVYYDYDNYDIYDVDAQKVRFNMVEGVIKIVDTIVGDVNSDGVVNNLDRMVLTRYLANWKEYTSDMIDMLAADVNGDGNVNNLDRLILTRYLGNWEGYDTLPYVN